MSSSVGGAAPPDIFTDDYAADHYHDYYDPDYDSDPADEVSPSRFVSGDLEGWAVKVTEIRDALAAGEHVNQRVLLDRSLSEIEALRGMVENREGRLGAAEDTAAQAIVEARKLRQEMGDREDAVAGAVKELTDLQQAKRSLEQLIDERDELIKELTAKADLVDEIVSVLVRAGQVTAGSWVDAMLDQYRAAIQQIATVLLPAAEEEEQADYESPF